MREHSDPPNIEWMEESVLRGES